MSPSIRTAGLSDDGDGSPRGAASFKRYFNTVRHHLLLIVACTLLTLGAAYVYVKKTPPAYTSQSELLVNAAPASDTTLFSLPVLHTTGDPTRDVVTAASLVTTPQVAQAVIKSLHLHTSVSSLLGEVEANPLADSNIVAVQVQAPGAAQAQATANAFAIQAVATRTATLHQSLTSVIPEVRASAASVPASTRDLTGSVSAELAELKQLQTVNDPTLSVAAPAPLPTAPTSPRSKLSLAAGALAGLLIGIGAAFGIDALDPRLRREEQLDRFGGIPVLARIPRVRNRLRRRKQRPLVPDELPVLALEQYRMLRATLSIRSSGSSQAYLLTGTAPSEGKTTSAIGLAQALAQPDGDVILIEADLRRPTIARVLGLQEHHCTDEVLRGEIELERALVPVALDGRQMRVLAARAGDEGGDLLTAQASRRLVAAAKECAEYVVIDSPPLTAVVDAFPLAQAVDEVVVVTCIERTRLNKLSELFDLLSLQRTTPAGFVVVGVTERDRSNDAYYKAPANGRSRAGAGRTGELAGHQVPTSPAPRT